MTKVLFWVVVITAIALITRILTIHNSKQQHKKTVVKKQTTNAYNNQQPEEMVRCSHCGIHLPRSEAVLSGGKTWCSTDHAKLGSGAIN